MFKNIYLLMTDRDETNLKKLLLDPMHVDIKDDLSRVIETDSEGLITFFMPISNMQWSLIFYIQNLMLMQRMNAFDVVKRDLEELKVRLNKLMETKAID